MDFRLLGPFEVWHDDKPISIGAHRQRAVLALLAIHAGRVLSTDQIVDEIWGDDAPPSAVRTVHAYVSRLRSSLRVARGSASVGDVLVSRDPGYALNVDPQQIDAARFEEGLVQASISMKEGRPELANETIQRALSLWRGTALADFVYEPFAASESDRLNERRLEAIELRIDTDLALARHGHLISELESLIVSHPLRERYWAQLMIALYRSGRQSDALAAYGRVRRMLIDELGIEPGPELRRLEGLVLEQSPDLAWSPPLSDTYGRLSSASARQPQQAGFSARWRSQTSDLLPFVDRMEQFATLQQLLDAPTSGASAQLVLILGEPGCGKSRLLTEFGRRAVDQEVLVGSGSAERETSLPYGPFADVLRDVLDSAGSETLDRFGHLKDDLTWLLPELGPAPSLDADNLAPVRGRVVEAVMQVLGGVGDQRPLLVLIDDAHRLGEGSMALLMALLGRPWERTVTVVVACRAGVEDWGSSRESLIDLLKHDGTVTLEVDRLRSHDLSELVDRLEIQSPDLDGTDLASRLVVQTGGVPLLVREVLAIWKSDTDVLGPSLGGSISISPLVESVIGQRLDQLSDRTRRVLQVAAIIGMQFDIENVARASRNTSEEALESFDEALGRGIVVETDHYDTFAFDHGLIREVLVGSVPRSRAVRVHSSAAKGFAARGSAIEAAEHALEAVPDLGTQQMVELVTSGTDAALASLQFERARSLGRGGLEVLDGLDETPTAAHRVDLLIRVGRAEALTGRVASAEEAWQVAADLARSAGDSERLARVSLATDLLSRNVESSKLRWELLTESLERSGPNWTKLRLQVASEWLNEAATPDHRAVTPDIVDEVVGGATRLGDLPVLVAVYRARHAWSRFGHDPRKRQWTAEFLEAATSLGQDEWLFHAHLACLIDAMADADGDGVDRSLELLREAGARVRMPRDLWFRELATATCARLRGEFELADEHIARLSVLGERYGISDTAAVVGAVAYTNAYHHGDLGRLREPLEVFAETDLNVPAWLLAAGVAALSDADVKAASEILERGVALLTDGAYDGLWLTAVCLAVEIAARVDSGSHFAARLIHLLEPYSGQYAIVGTLTTEYGPIDRCLGMLEFMRGNADKASLYFASGVEACARLRAAPWEWLTRHDWRAVEQLAGGPARSWWSGLPEVTRPLPPIIQR